MRYKPRSIAALQVALGGLPARMQVEVDRDVSVSAKSVAELRKVTVWPENLVITTPHDRRPKSAIRVSKAGRAKRLFPKP
jgi:hypothetical protein